MMPANDLIQNILALSQLRRQREQTMLERERMAGNQRIADSTMLTTVMDTLSRLPSRGREQYVAGLRGILPDSMVDQVSGALPGFTPSLDVLTRETVVRGLEGMPAADRAVLERETATARLSGQNIGQQAGSQLQDFLLMSGSADKLSTEFGGEMTRQFRTGAMERMSSGQDVGGAAISRRVAGTPGLAQFGAEVQVGSRLTAPQEANLQLNYAQLNAQIDQAMTQGAQGWAQLKAQRDIGLARARAESGVTPAQQTELIKQAIDIVTLMEGKSMNDAARQINAAILNRILPQLGLPQIQPGDDLPSVVRGIKATFGAGTGGRAGAAVIPVSPDSTGALPANTLRW